jgi:hypothetical protein
MSFPEAQEQPTAPREWDVIITMKSLRLPTAVRYLAAPVAALTLAAIGMASAPAALAASSGLCLTNSRSNCVSLQLGTSGNAILNTDVLQRIIVVRSDSDGHSEAEFKWQGDPSENQCLADTGLSVGVNANFQNCGANGTVWVLVPHSNGAYLESRFALNRGELLVLTANSASHFTQLYVNSPADPGSVFWQTFSYFG